MYNWKFGAKLNMSPNSAVSPIGGLIQGVEISPTAKSHGLKSNALAYAESRSTSVPVTFLLVDQTSPNFFC